MKKQTSFLLVLSLFALVFAACKKDEDPKPQLITAAGDITAAIAEYRALLGADNAGTTGPQDAGRREINWDGVPDDQAAPNFLPADFFNASDGGRARGITLSTPGNGVQAAADSDNPTATATSFGNINAYYTAAFTPFSGERVFSPVGSNIVDVHFFVTGTSTPGVVHGFGAVYIDVDRTENTAFEFFDINDKSLGSYAVPPQDNGFSFLGVRFDEAIVHRVRIEYGSSALGPDESATVDVAVMDDFIYAEPQRAE